MRNISFALTTPQFLDGTKTVTRRDGWESLQAGDKLTAVKKGMGLKKGEKIEVLGQILITNVRREKLARMTDDLDYGFAETVREGFPEGHPYHWPSEFVDFFCKSHRGCYPNKDITRIEYVKLPPAARPSHSALPWNIIVNLSSNKGQGD